MHPPLDLAALVVALTFLQKLAVFLLMLSVLIVLHEYGHFVMARVHGVQVNDFAIGFGPTLIKWTSPRSGTNYRINLLPIGGYCAMQGEDGKTNEAEQQRAFRGSTAGTAQTNFQAKSALQRLSISLAGPIANFILAFVILLVAAFAFGVTTDNVAPTIGPVTDNSPAQRAGLRPGDEVLAINGVPVKSGVQLIDTIHGSLGVPLHLQVRRGGGLREFAVTPRRDVQEGKVVGVIGFHPILGLKHVGPVEAVTSAADEFGHVFVGSVVGVAQLFANPVKHFSAVTGPIGIERAAAEIQDLGWGPYFDLAAMISMALGIFNLLPFPALDGGRAAFIIAELLRGRPVDPEKEAVVHVAGFALLMALMLFVAFHDISNIIAGKGVL